VKILTALLAGVLATIGVIIAGPWSLAYLAIYVLATVPGWPLGRALFGRHPAAWIAGALAGYGLTSLALWIVIAFGVPSAIAFVLAWAIVGGISWASFRARGPFVSLPELDRGSARVLLLLVLLVPAVFVFPYKNLGARDAEGNRYYRAYFTADFFLHAALTAELTKYDMPPHTPYAGDRSLQYYWTYFLLPAVVAEEGPRGLANVETCLEANAYCTAVLFLSMLILATWAASGSAPATALALLVAVLAASAEGVYIVRDLVERGRPLSELTDWNIDAVTAWEFTGLRIDSLVRSMWYNPQHSLSAALGLVSWLVLGSVGIRASIGAVALTGAMLALSTVFNPLVGGLFSMIYGIVVALDAVRTRQFLLLGRHAVAALLVGLAVVYCVGNRMVEGAGGVVLFGLGGFARNRPVATLLLSLGPLLVPAILGLWPIRQLTLRVWPALAASVVGLLCLYLVRLSMEGSYIGFRAGHLLQLALPSFAALFFARLWQKGWRAAAVAIALALMAVGVPTTAIDVYNAQDIHNTRMSPGGFRWTVVLTPAEQRALQWIRYQTPKDALVQMDPVAHGRETWSQIPTFGWRRMAASQSIVPPLMSADEYEQRWRRAHAIYDDVSVETAWRLARDLNVDYLFIGPAEYAANAPERLAKFGTRPDLFAEVFANDRTKIYRVVK
jgi:hypothetical protein